MNEINSVENQVRLFACRKNGDRYYRIGYLPEMDGVMEAAGWLRRNGHPSLTNQSFRSLISDLVGKVVSEEEAHCARVLTGVFASFESNVSCSIFVTKEEKDHVEALVKAGEIQPDQIMIIDTCLGGYVELVP